jgi:hypothetical protein
VAPGTNSDGHGVTDQGVVSALGFDNMGFQREFTLVGMRPCPKTGSPKTEGFANVEWALLLTSEIAPPYSTCRLNFHYPSLKGDDDPTQLTAYVDWVVDAWEKTGTISSQLFDRILCDLSRVDPPQPGSTS